jgi:hypothetical protein
MILLSEFGSVLHVKTIRVPWHMSIVMFFVMVLLWSCGQSNQQKQYSDYDLSTAQATLKSAFKALQENDTSAFKSMLATKEDFVSYYQAENALDGTKITQKEIDEKASAKIAISWQLSSMLKRFIRTREEGLADGIEDWKETTLFRASANYQNELRQSDSRLLFNYKENIGAIKFGHLIKSKRGWVIESGIPEYSKMVPSRFIK